MRRPRPTGRGRFAWSVGVSTVVASYGHTVTLASLSGVSPLAGPQEPRRCAMSITQPTVSPADSAGASTPLQLSSSVRALAAAMEPVDPPSVLAVLPSLRVAFADHRAATEGTTGLYADL